MTPSRTTTVPSKTIGWRGRPHHHSNLRALGLRPADLELKTFWGGVRLEAGPLVIELMDLTPKDLAGVPWLL